MLSTYPDRRRVVAALALLPLAACTGARRQPAEPDFAALERSSGGRVGFAALDLASGRSILHRADERFAMCSTFKWLLGAFVLARVSEGYETLDRRIAYRDSDLVFRSPVTEQHVGVGLAVGEMCAATIRTSDNTAANLLLQTLGGPEGFTARLRALGDAVTRLDRWEPALNENAPGDPRDTTTPAAMLGLMRRVLFGDVLNEAARATLRDWMMGTTTGAGRLRAGIPAGWSVGHKTGTSNADQNNDVGFALPPAGITGGPILIASFLNVPEPGSPAVDGFHADAARAAIRAFGVSLRGRRPGTLATGSHLA